MKKRLLVLMCVISILIPSFAFAQAGGKDDVVYGVALTDEQKTQVNQAFGLAGNEDINFSSINGAAAEKYLGYLAPDRNMISSVYIKRLSEGSGIKVNIVTPANITQITNAQYTNAAITAGISDADIYVASPTPVTGESALAGVYYALEQRGEDIDVERAQTAQKELEVVNEINEDNKTKLEFNPAELDKVIIEVKQRLAAHKEETGETASVDQIGIYINDALKHVNMENILSNNNINILIQYFEKYQDTSAIDSQEVKENLIKLGNDLANSASEFYENNKDQIDDTVKKAQESGLIDKILNFLSSLVNAIAQMFAGESSN